MLAAFWCRWLAVSKTLVAVNSHTSSSLGIVVIRSASAASGPAVLVPVVVMVVVVRPGLLLGLGVRADDHLGGVAVARGIVVGVAVVARGGVAVDGRLRGQVRAHGGGPRGAVQGISPGETKRLSNVIILVGIRLL